MSPPGRAGATPQVVDSKGLMAPPPQSAPFGGLAVVSVPEIRPRMRALLDHRYDFAISLPHSSVRVPSPAPIKQQLARSVVVHEISGVTTGESPTTRQRPAGVAGCPLVPEARLELAYLAAEDFESPASTIPPLGPAAGLSRARLARQRAPSAQRRGARPGAGRREGVAIGQPRRTAAGHEPPRPLVGGAVGEGMRHRSPTRRGPQHFVADAPGHNAALLRHRRAGSRCCGGPPPPAPLHARSPDPKRRRGPNRATARSSTGLTRPPPRAARPRPCRSAR